MPEPKPLQSITVTFDGEPGADAQRIYTNHELTIVEGYTLTFTERDCPGDLDLKTLHRELKKVTGMRITEVTYK